MSCAGDSRRFEVKVELHQGSVLSHLLFPIVMDMVGDEEGQKRTVLGMS